MRCPEPSPSVHVNENVIAALLIRCAAGAPLARVEATCVRY
jgi:hypothetical protein